MITNILKHTLIAIALALSLTTAAQGVTPKEAKEAIETFLDRVEFNGYAQAGYEYNDEGGTTTSTMNLKRTLLWATAKVTDKWTFRFMHDFNSEVQEYWLDYDILGNGKLKIRAGQFKNSYTIENPLSPVSLELVDICSQGVTYLAGCGSDPLNGVNYGRDLGVKVYGDLGAFHYEVAVMNGQGINTKDGNADKDILIRLDYCPTKELRLVVTGQKGRGHAVGTAEWNPTIAVGENYRRDRASAGFEYTGTGNHPLYLRGEGLWGKDGSVTSLGAYCTGRLTIAKAVDIIASVDFFDKNTNMDYDQTNITAGIQYWFFRKCRLQLQYTRKMPQWESDYNCLQAQFQVGF